MSRYDWPLVRKKRHHGMERLRFDDRTSGLMTEKALASARFARSAAGSTLRAPNTDVDLWVPIGPSTVVLSQVNGRPRVTGRVRDVAVSPDGTRVYAATATGGVWYSADSGASWSPIGNWSATPTIETFLRGANALSCGCLLVTFGSAADGSGDDVYVGTGETRDPTSGAHGDQAAGAGVLHLAVPLADALANPFGDPWQREAPNLAGFGIYRLARDPADPNRLVAATEIGLFTRQGNFQANRPWTQVKKGPLDFDADDNEWTTDVLWTASGRLFVALIDDTRFSDTGVHVSTHGVEGPFDEVNLDDIDEPRKIRIGLAVAPSDPNLVYVLTSGPKLWRITGTSGDRILRPPKLLFGNDDQSEYDLAIAVDPRDPKSLILGGAGRGANAMLFSCSVGVDADGRATLDFDEANDSAPEKDVTWIGDGVHADVHAAFFVDVAGADGAHLWVATDGGLFRSTTRDKRQRFAACNTGLASLQCGYVASHPIHECYMFTGTQDNGTLSRVGDTVWIENNSFGGDGGCVVVHPVQSRFAVGHEHNASWNSNDSHFTEPVLRSHPTAAAEKAQETEGANAAFYSAADVRVIDGSTRIALGTNRVWVSEDWDPAAGHETFWKTVPSGTDPYKDDGTDIKTDTFKGSVGKVISCRWASDNRLVVLCRRAVLVFNRTAQDDWTRKVISDHKPKCGDIENSDIATDRSEWLPPRGVWTDIAIYDNGGDNGRFYVATTGYARMDDNTPKEFDRMDTLWWYDGSGHFYPTGLRNHNTPPNDVGTEAPATAVAVDLDNKDVVYVGTAIGVWRGELTFVGNTPTWKWQMFSNGLPETVVYDLAFFRHQGLKLLRAALGSRGIWEVDLSTDPRPVARTYLRVHAFDTRRRALTSTLNPAPLPVVVPWYASPDIRIRPAPGPTPPPAPHGDALDWTDQVIMEDRFHFWTFQTAFRVVEPLCRPDGTWSAQFERLLRIRTGQTVARINRAVWETFVTAANAFQNPWGDAEPTEADLYELVLELPSMATGIPPRRSELQRRRYRVDVLVHHRHQLPVAHDRVRVTLLRRPILDTEAQWKTVAISGTWKTRVTQLLSAATVPAGFTLPDGWVIADTQRVLSPRLDVDARNPRVVTFDVNFGALTGARRHFVLLAVVHSDPDPVTVDTLTGANLEELILFSHHVAARVVVV